MLTDNNAQKLTRAGGGRGRCKEVVIVAAQPPPPHNRPLRSPPRPGLYTKGDIPPCLENQAVPQLSSQAEAGGEGRPPGAPLQGVHPDLSQMGGGGGRGGRGVASTRAASRKGRVSRGHGAEARPFHYPATRLPLCFLVVEQLWLGRRHYHIALRGSRHLTAGTKEAGGRQAVKSTSGWSIEQLGGVAPRGAPSGPSTIERLRLGPERPPASGGPRWSPCRAGGPGTVPVRRRRHFTRASEVRATRG